MYIYNLTTMREFITFEQRDRRHVELGITFLTAAPLDCLLFIAGMSWPWMW